VLNHVLALAFSAGLAAVPVTAQTAPSSQEIMPQVLPTDAQRLLALANESRVANGAAPLKWDPALAAAALQHCRRMAAEGNLSHQFDGEASLTGRAGQAGAHFSTVEENIAAGSAPTDPLEFHDGWMHSPGHRANLLNPAVDSVGIAVVVSHAITYAVADYARAVPALTQTEVEKAFAALLRAKGLSILKTSQDARAYCAWTEGSRSLAFYNVPRYRMFWQNPDLTQLPQELVSQLATGHYRKAAIASCPPHDVEGEFTVYRVAVLLY
jgi:uncharacterized protein YkwD